MTTNLSWSRAASKIPVRAYPLSAEINRAVRLAGEQVWNNYENYPGLLS